MHYDKPFLLSTHFQVSDAPALGSAILAAVAAGWYPDIPTAVSSMVHVGQNVTPDASVRDEYKQHYGRYKQLYPALAPIYHGGVSKQPNGRSAAPPPAAAASGPRGIVSPSILASDFANLASEVKRAADGGAEWCHVDMFDSTYVANFTIGPPVLASLRKHTHLMLDCHLCVSDPRKYLQQVSARCITSTFMWPKCISAKRVNASCHFMCVSDPRKYLQQVRAKCITSMCV